MNTTDAIITLLGSAILGLSTYIFTQLRSEFREFKQDVKDILSGFKQDIRVTSDNMQKILDGFDKRIQDVERNKKRK